MNRVPRAHRDVPLFYHHLIDRKQTLRTCSLRTERVERHFWTHACGRLSMETAVLPHLQDHSLHFALFKNVTNASFLRQQLLDGNTDFEYAFLDASVLLSRRHIFAACFRAINDSLAGRMKSRNVHSEIVFSLSPTNNVCGFASWHATFGCEADASARLLNRFDDSG